MSFLHKVMQCKENMMDDLNIAIVLVISCTIFFVIDGSVGWFL